MKSILITLMFIAFTATTSTAQNQPAKPIEKAKVETAKTADKAKMKMAKSSTKMKMTKSPATNGLDSAKSTMKTKMGTHKTTHAKSANSAAMANPKMHFKCPKGDALSDTGGKCPVCGTEMEAMDHTKMMMKSAKKMDGTNMKKEKEKEEKKG